MNLKKLKKSFRFFAVLLISIPNLAFAYSDYIIASGENIGIEIKSKGAIVVGTYEVNNKNISKSSNLRLGDTITKMGNKTITSTNDFIDAVNSSNCDSKQITYLRDNKEYETTIYLSKENGYCKSGLYIKDSITGIGTLTFIDPSTKLFGALGHEIVEKNTGKILETNNGTIFDSEVTNIEKSRNGMPGEKNAKYYSKNINGKIYENTNQGIFGVYTSQIKNENLYKVASSKDIKLGEAKIRTVISGTDVKEYSITITKLVDNQDTKNIYFDITDEILLKETGGIVQGMSGSPIIQGDYIIGAVTHVVVDNPEKGYGIYITNMLEQAEN